MSLRARFLLFGFVALGVIASFAVATVMVGVQDKRTRRQIELDLRESAILLALESEIEALRGPFVRGGAGESRPPREPMSVARARELVAELRASVASDEIPDDDDQKEMQALAQVEEDLARLEAIQGRAGSGGITPELAEEHSALCLRLHAGLELFRQGCFEEVYAAAVDLDRRRTKLLWLLAGGLVAMTILLAAAWIGFAYGVLRPVKNLMRMTRRLSRIDFDVEVRATPAGELGELTRSFLSMTRALEGFTREIELRVRERTRELEDSRAISNLMLDSLPDAVGLRTADGRLVASNGAYRSLFGGDSPAMPFLAKAERSPQGYVVWKEGGGSTRLLDAQEFGGSGPPGQLGALRLEYVRDVTHLAQVEAALAQSSRLVALGRMAAGIAHEVNNPLTAIGACAEGLLKRAAKGGIDAAVLREYLEVIHREVYRCKALTGKMLDVSRQRAESPVPTEVRNLVEESLRLFAQVREDRRVDIRLLPGPPCTALVQPAALCQILINLIMNALQAVEDGGRITVEVARRGGEVVLSVADDGHGIPPESMKDLFEPFFTEGRGKDGTGLGLFLSRELASAMGGSLVARSEGPGRGARFELAVPAAEEQPRPTPTEAHPA